MKRHNNAAILICMLFLVFVTSSCSNKDIKSDYTTTIVNTEINLSTDAQITSNTMDSTTGESSRNTSSSLNKARELNDNGYNEYKKGNYKTALDLFKQSMEFDYKYYLSHYNYACTLGVLMKKDYPEWYEHKKEVIDHLAKVKELNPGYIDKIKTDPDLSPVRKEFGYMLMLGYSPSKTEDVKQILQKLDWYVEGEGIFPYAGGIKFNKDSTVTFWYHSPEFFKDYQTGAKYEVKGKYSVTGNKITIKLDEKMLKKRNWNDIVNNSSILEDRTTINARLTQDGIIENDMFDYKIKYFYPEFSA